MPSHTRRKPTLQRINIRGLGLTTASRHRPPCGAVFRRWLLSQRSEPAPEEPRMFFFCFDCFDSSLLKHANLLGFCVIAGTLARFQMPSLSKTTSTSLAVMFAMVSFLAICHHLASRNSHTTQLVNIHGANYGYSVTVNTVNKLRNIEKERRSLQDKVNLFKTSILSDLRQMQKFSAASVKETISERKKKPANRRALALPDDGSAGWRELEIQHSKLEFWGDALRDQMLLQCQAATRSRKGAAAVAAARRCAARVERRARSYLHSTLLVEAIPKELHGRNTISDANGRDKTAINKVNGQRADPRELRGIRSSARARIHVSQLKEYKKTAIDTVLHHTPICGDCLCMHTHISYARA